MPALGQAAGDGHAVGLLDQLGIIGEKCLKLLGRDLGAALEQLGLVAVVEDGDAGTALARDGREAVRDVVGVHQAAEVRARMSTKEARRKHVIAQLNEHAADV